MVVSVVLSILLILRRLYPGLDRADHLKTERVQQAHPLEYEYLIFSGGGIFKAGLFNCTAA